MKPSALNYSQAPVEFQKTRSWTLLGCLKCFKSRAIFLASVFCLANFCLVWWYAATDGKTWQSTNHLSEEFRINESMFTTEPGETFVWNDSNFCTASRIIAQNASRFYRQRLDQALFLTWELASEKSERIMSWKRRPLPYGLKGVSPGKLKSVLLKLHSTRRPWTRDNQSCLAKCIVIGNGGILLNHTLGTVIDSYDAVIRINAAPTINFTEHVGEKTTFRFFYPESSDLANLDDENMEEAILVMTMFSPSALDWLDAIYKKSGIKKRRTFWKATGDPRDFDQFKQQIRILSPSVVDEAQRLLEIISYARPTTGLIAIMFASKICDSVDIAGFSYNQNDPAGRLHYYDDLKMEQMVCQNSVHDVHAEAQLIRSFAEMGVLADLTGGIVNNSSRVAEDSLQPATSSQNVTCKPYVKKKLQKLAHRWRQ